MNDPAPAEAGIEIVSPVFRDGSAIPYQYTCRGQNVNPPLNFLSKPGQTQSFTLIMHDPDAPGGNYLHWLMWDIPPGTETISANSVPVGAVQGKNSAGQNNYTGPCPPKGSAAHRYIFDIYALDTTLDLPTATELNEVLKAQKGHVLAHCSLIGTFAIEN